MVLPLPIPTELDLDVLAHDVALTGPRANEPGLTAVAGAATKVGVCRVLVSVLLDRTAPDVVRARAFGRIAVELAAHVGSGAIARNADSELLCA
jgi:hypothetical protein